MDAHVNSFQLPGTGPKETCKACYVRKVKCDGVLAGCRNCRRLGFQCCFRGSDRPRPGSLQDERTSSLGVPDRRRVRRACLACREKKIKCSGAAPRCSNCRRRDEPCSYPTGKRPLRRLADDDGNDQPTATTQLDGRSSPQRSDADMQSFSQLPEDLANLVDLFFEKLYPLPSCAFLHPATTRKQCIRGSIDRPLALAIAALVTLRCQSGHQEQNHLWIQAAEQAIWQQLECLRVSRLQALVLIIQYRMETGRFQRAFMLTAMAARFAAAMRLNHEHPELSPVAREVRRRVVWSLKLVERYFSIGLPEFEVCPFESIYLELPASEETFSSADQQSEPATLDASDMAAYKLSIKLETIRRDVMKLNRSMALCDEAFPLLPKIIQDFERELAITGSEIPKNPGASPSMIFGPLSNTWLPRHVLLHLSWHQCHCDLYRLLLTGYQEAAPSVVLRDVDSSVLSLAEQQCLQHAASIIRIVTTLNEQSFSSFLLEFDTAICVYQAVRLTLHFSRLSNGYETPSPEFAISRADLCIAALKRFFPRSVLVRPIIEEISRLAQEYLVEGQSSSRVIDSFSNNNRKDPSQKLSAMAKARERLAIHSLLLQAECTDADEDEEPRASSPPLTDYGLHSGSMRPDVASEENDFSRLNTGQRSITSNNSSSPKMLGPSSHSDGNMFLVDQHGSEISDARDANGDSPEIPNDLKFPLFPWCVSYS